MEIKCIWINEELNHLRVCQAVTEMQRCSALQVPLTLSSSAAVRPSLLLFTPLIFTSFLPVSQCLIFFLPVLAVIPLLLIWFPSVGT